VKIGNISAEIQTEPLSNTRRKSESLNELAPLIHRAAGDHVYLCSLPKLCSTPPNFAGFLLFLLFDSEDGGDLFLRVVIKLHRLQSRIPHSSSLEFLLLFILSQTSKLLQFCFKLSVLWFLCNALHWKIIIMLLGHLASLVYKNERDRIFPVYAAKRINTLHLA
jgi:hypothetical protein